VREAVKPFKDAKLGALYGVCNMYVLVDALNGKAEVALLAEVPQECVDTVVEVSDSARCFQSLARRSPRNLLRCRVVECTGFNKSGLVRVYFLGEKKPKRLVKASALDKVALAQSKTLKHRPV